MVAGDAELRAAMVAGDAVAVAKLALGTVGPKDACLSFFAKVIDAVAKGPVHPTGPPPADGKKRKPTDPVDAKGDAKVNKSDMGLDFFEKDIQDQSGSLYILLPNLLVGSLIGKAGSTIKSVSRKSGAKVDVEKNSTYGENRLVSIVGTLKQVTLASYLMIEACTLETVYLLVPNGICGLIIGKQGANIKKLEKETRATLKMESFESDECRKVMISGEARVKCHAQYLIASLITANESRMGVFDPRKPSGGGNDPSRQSDQGGGGQGYQAIAYTTNPSMSMQQRIMQEQQEAHQQLQQQQMMQQQGGMGMGNQGMGNQGMMQANQGMMGASSGMMGGMQGQQMQQQPIGMMGGSNQGMMGGMGAAGSMGGMQMPSNMQQQGGNSIGGMMSNMGRNRYN